jgi:hypothetical protein
MSTVYNWFANTVPETCVAVVFVVTMVAAWWTLTDWRDAWARRRQLLDIALRTTAWSASPFFVIAVVWYAVVDHATPAYDVLGSWCWNCSEWADGIMETLQNCVQVAALGVLTSITAVVIVKTLSLRFGHRAH